MRTRALIPRRKKHLLRNSKDAEVRGCLRKVRYSSEAEIKCYMEASKNPNLRIYKCKYCEGFHMSTIKKI